MILAIDFGTSNTVVARWNTVTQHPETLSLPHLSVRQAQNPPLIPSLVYLENAQIPQIVAGQAVRDRGLNLRQDPRFFQSFKRGIGGSSIGFRPELDQVSVGFEQVGTWFLQAVVRGIEQIPLSLDSLVLTVPVDSFEPYRHWLGQVFAGVAVEQIRLVDEPTAAALGYGMADRELLLVMDFGGGTLDLALVRLESRRGQPLGFILKWGQKNFGESGSGQRSTVARVLAKAGRNLGGADIDQWIAEYLIQSRGLNPGLRSSPLILRLAERLKIQLSQQPSATEVYFDDETFDSYEFTLDRPELAQILNDRQFFTQCEQSLFQVWQQARRQGIEASDIQGVLLVGGTSQLTAVQAWLQTQFPLEKIQAHRPFEAIVQGALQVAQGVEVKDFLYHSYGLRYWNHRTQRQDWHPLIRAGQTYPFAEPVELVLGASVDRQPNLELVLGELGDEESSTEVYFDGDRFVTRSLHSQQRSVIPLNDSDRGRALAPLNPPGSPGVDRLRVLFTVDEKRQLRATVEDLLTLETIVENQAIVELG